MACSVTLNGIVRDCAPNVGGLKLVAFANRDDVASITLDSTEGKVSAITMTETGKFKGFYFKKGQASYNQTPQFNEAGEYAGEQGVLAVNFGRQDTSKRVQCAALSIAELYALLQDNNGIYWLVGYDAPVLRTGGESPLGQNATDFNHYGMEFTSNDKQLAYEVPAEVALGVLA